MWNHVVRAVFKRDFIAYFGNPTGYVFITIFVFLSAVSAFWPERFFASNLANLDTLSDVFPLLLLFFVPAVTMSAWAEERKQGTDELLLTLPAHHANIVWGKYLGVLAIYTVALLFSLSNALMLAYLGEPDWGLLLSTYLGYWLLGAALLGLGMVGSLLATNVTIGFIFGALLCSVIVFLDVAGAMVGGTLGTVLERFGARSLFAEFGSGVVSIPGLVFFGGTAALAVFANISLLRLRHKSGRTTIGIHEGLRLAAVLVSVISLSVLVDRLPVRPDLTAERLHSLSPDTIKLLDEIDPERPVYVQAFISPEVPKEYVEARNNLLNLLREYDQIGGSRVLVRIHRTEKYTEEAQEAQDKFGIYAAPVATYSDGRGSSDEIFLGFAMTCGLQEVVVPFLSPGLPVEYELTRSIRVAARKKRLKVGVLATDAKLNGGFDFQSMQSSPEWGIVQELKKQYEVVQVDAGSDYPTDLDVLLAAMPSSLTQPELDRFRGYVESDKPTLIFDDPMPNVNQGLAPSSPKPKPGGMFGQGPQPEPKGDISALLRDIGIDWPKNEIAWDSYNPHPQFAGLPPEVVFVGTGGKSFDESDATTSGLQEMVLIFPGHVRPQSGSPVQFKPLVRGTEASGRLLESDLLQRSFFGVQMKQNRDYRMDPMRYTFAARVQGSPASGGAVNLIFVADLDMVAEQFFQMRAQGGSLQFDNVTFVLNAVDVLAGDESFVNLRKRRRKHRTLTKMEKSTSEYTSERLERTTTAEEHAKAELKKAQAALDAKVAELEGRTDLDARTKQIMVSTLQENEERKFRVQEAKIEREKKQKLDQSRSVMESQIRSIQRDVRFVAVALPPVPALLVGVWVLLGRLGRERRGIADVRRVKD